MFVLLLFVVVVCCCGLLCWFVVFGFGLTGVLRAALVRCCGDAVLR